MTVQMWQQLLGGNVAMYYVVYIFEMAGMVSLADRACANTFTDH
jgi:hypothetical protein